MNGRSIYTKNIEAKEHAVDMMNYPKGVYFIRMETLDYSLIRKIVKE